MTEQEKIKKWVATWQQADSALKEIKKAELQDENYYAKNLDLLCGMLQYAYDHREERQTSGLLIQQQRFKKLAQSRAE
jgi:hypothetical protein